MDCKTAHDLLPLYFDGELDRATGREFEAHLDECADCRAALIELDALRRTLREDAPRYIAPETLRARIQKHTVTRDVPASSRLAPRRWLALAASWAIAFAAGGAMMTTWNHASNSGYAQSQLTRDLFVSHWRALAATSPVDVVSTDQHTVKPWFNGKLDFSPPVKDLAAQEFPLIGGRLDYIGGRSVAALVFHRNKHVINLFIWPVNEKDSNPAVDASIQGYNVIHWSEADMTFWAASDLNEKELMEFAQDFAAGETLKP